MRYRCPGRWRCRTHHSQGPRRLCCRRAATRPTWADTAGMSRPSMSPPRVDVVVVVGIAVVGDEILRGLLLPHEARGVVGDRAVAVVDEARAPAAADVEGAVAVAGQPAVGIADTQQ